jgi:uncharacterized membrane protein
MDPIENDVDTNGPVESTSSRSSIILALIIVGVQALTLLFVYPVLPDRVPIHWDINGQINNYAPKASVFLWPLLSLALFFLIRFLVRIGPRLGQTGPRANGALVDRLLVGIVLFLLFTQLITIAAALSMPINVTFIVSLLMGVLFIFIGNYMGKLRRNYWAGIRTPWTLANDAVWERTHRVGGWLFVGAGLILLGLSFFSEFRVVGMIVVPTLLAVGLVGYSYVVYRRVVE